MSVLGVVEASIVRATASSEVYCLRVTQRVSFVGSRC